MALFKSKDKSLSKNTAVSDNTMVPIKNLDLDSDPDSQIISQDSIVVDSGASAHIFNDMKWFIKYQTLVQPIEISSSNGGDSIATASSTVAFTALKSDGNEVD